MTIPFQLHADNGSDTGVLIIASKTFQLPSLFQLPPGTKYSGPLFHSLFADIHTHPSERAKHVLLTTLGQNPAFFDEVFSHVQWYKPNIQRTIKKRKQVRTQVHKNTKNTMREMQPNVQVGPSYLWTFLSGPAAARMRPT